MNDFRQKLEKNKKLYGLWLGSGSAYMAQIASQANYDWYLIDGEHGPNTIESILNQVTSLECYNSTSIVRVLDKNASLIKQVLDIGAKTILVPMVNTYQEAELMVSASKYAPEGIRGVGGYIVRAARWGSFPKYQQEANRDIFLILQCETKQGLQNLEKILTLKGVDSIFIGPADLSVSMGYSDIRDEEFKKIWFDAIRLVRSYGKYVGTLALDKDLADECFAAGAHYVAIEVDVTSYIEGIKDTLVRFSQ